MIERDPGIMQILVIEEKDCKVIMVNLLNKGKVGENWYKYGWFP